MAYINLSYGLGTTFFDVLLFFYLGKNDESMWG